MGGGIPTQWSNMASLRYIDLSSNDVGGQIPTQFGALNNIERIWLRNMNLVGNIPTQVGELQTLKTLSLSKFPPACRFPLALADCRETNLVLLIDFIVSADLKELKILFSCLFAHRTPK